MRVSFARVHFRRAIEIKGWSRCFDIQMDDPYEANPDVTEANSVTKRERNGGLLLREKDRNVPFVLLEERSMVHSTTRIILL